MIVSRVTRLARNISALACIGLASVSLVAAEETASSRTQLSMTAATTMEFQTKIAHAYDLRDNLTLKLSASVSPVSVNATAGTSWLPFPFLELALNSSIGSGWNISIADGLRINQRVEGTNDRELVGSAFAGLVLGVEGGAAFQLDYAALVPGDWNHILFRTYHGLKYQAFTAADAGESWLYQADEGENRNGWSYAGTTFIGYQMPVILNTIGLLAEGNLYLYDSPEGEIWGDDLMQWTLGAVMNFTVTSKLGLTIISQARTARNFTSATEDYGFYQDRVVTDDPVRLQFYRFAAILTLTL
ncbi:MAG: hypothetical protein AB7T74_10675 [Clostridia bacterium]